MCKQKNKYQQIIDKQSETHTIKLLLQLVCIVHVHTYIGYILLYKWFDWLRKKDGWDCRSFIILCKGFFWPNKKLKWKQQGKNDQACYIVNYRCLGKVPKKCQRIWWLTLTSRISSYNNYLPWERKKNLSVACDTYVWSNWAAFIRSFILRMIRVVFGKQSKNAPKYISTKDTVCVLWLITCVWKN